MLGRIYPDARLRSMSLAALTGLLLFGLGCTPETVNPSPTATPSVRTPPVDTGTQTNGRIPLSDTGYTVELPEGWQLEEWTPAHLPPGWTPSSIPFLSKSTHNLPNKLWWVEHENSHGGVALACKIYYFVAPLDDQYLAWQNGLPQDPTADDLLGPPLNIEYQRTFGITATQYFVRDKSHFENDGATYYDLFAYESQGSGCEGISATSADGSGK